MTLFGANRGYGLTLVKSSKKPARFSRESPFRTAWRGSDWGVPVSVTGFSVSVTGKSVAQTVVTEGIFAPPSRRRASICAAAAVHVVGQKTHVLRTVCNAWRGTPCAFATALCHDYSCNEPSHGLLWRCVATKALWCRYVQSEVMNIGVSFSAFVKPQRS